MSRFALLASPLLVLLGCRGGPLGAPVVINEFRYESAGSEAHEFVELYNRSGLLMDLTGWQLSSQDSQGANASYHIPAGTRLAPCAYYIIGAKGVPGVDLVVGNGSLWENETESLTLIDADGRTVDTLVYEAHRGVWPGAGCEGEGIWGNLQSRVEEPTSWARGRDGLDTDNNRDFHLYPSTPGFSNDHPVRLPVRDDFEGGDAGDLVPYFGGSAGGVRVIDPLRQGPFRSSGEPTNPSALPSDSSVRGGSGGAAAIAWSPDSSGSMYMLLSDLVGDVRIEMMMYFDARPRPSEQSETWSLGVQGTTGSTFDTPDPAGTMGFVLNGNTGISLTYQVTDTNSVLYLIDHNDGGWGRFSDTPPRVLGTLTVEPGVNDGWQRLLLEVRGYRVTSEFGGRLGVRGSGRAMQGMLSWPAEGGVYIGHQELVTGIRGIRPPTFDDLSIVAEGQSIEEFGQALPTTHGTPRISFPELPRLGVQNYVVDIDGLVPGGRAMLILSSARLESPIALERRGGAPGAKLYIRPDAVFSLEANWHGRTRFSFDVPCDRSLVMSKMFWQVFDHDPALNVRLPLGASRAYSSVIR